MSRHYTAAELLNLRQSPLVSKPDGLPPVEAWMGSPPERAERTLSKPSLGRAKADDTSALESQNRRPTLFETRHLSRGSSTVPEDIILGPPRTAFASATSLRSFGSKGLDSPDRSTAPSRDDDSPRAERPNFREKLVRDRDRFEKENEKPRDVRSGVNNGRRIGREDMAESWAGVRSGKSFGNEEGERIVRRTTDRDKDRERDLGRDGKERSQRSHDSFIRERERDGDKDVTPRRNGVPRGRNESSWFRSDDQQPIRERDAPRDEGREKEWSHKDRAEDREWPRGGRVEREPEWMDSPIREEKKQVHTAEDFQRWKERMKAGNSSIDETPKAEETKEPLDPQGDFFRASVPKQEQKTDTPIVMDSGVDKFFSLWNEPKQNDARSSGEQDVSAPKKPVMKGPSGKASRFTSFFSPQEEAARDEIEPQPPPPPPPPPMQQLPADPSKISSAEDKEGFQRILQMLGGKGVDLGNSGPSTETSRRPKSPNQELAAQFAQSATLKSSGKDRGASNNASSTHRQEHSNPGSRSSTAMDSTLGRQAAQGVPANRNNEFLFSLMQQSTPISEPDHPIDFSRQYNLDNVPANISGEALFHLTQGVHPSKASGAREESTAAAARGRTPPGLFDDPSLAGFQRQQQPPQPQNEPVPNFKLSQNNISRPPGFEQVSAPAWGGNQFTAASHQRHVPPPPGLNSESANRGAPMFSPFILGPPPPPPLPPGMTFPVGNSRPGTVPANGPGLPSNMPPPGFYNMGGPPPPGYPPMPFHLESGMGGPPGTGGRPGGGPPFNPFAEVDNGGGAGGGGGGGGAVPGPGPGPGPSRGAPPPGQYRH
ncbi:MAG: hypothetical protein M1837_001867 [Sclerophora amabilis]|nr:MAG: hypothetical protein M1837_001867 [Sclerophora amabilis]